MSGFEFVNEQNKPENSNQQINHSLFDKFDKQKLVYLKSLIALFVLFAIIICCICLIATAKYIIINDWSHSYKIALFALLLSISLIPFIILYLRMFVILARIQDILLEWFEQERVYTNKIDQDQLAKLNKMIKYSIYLSITFISMLFFVKIFLYLQSVAKKT